MSTARGRHEGKSWEDKCPRPGGKQEGRSWEDKYPQPGEKRRISHERISVHSQGETRR